MAETAIAALQASRQQTLELVIEQGQKVVGLTVKEKSDLEACEEVSDSCNTSRGDATRGWQHRTFLIPSKRCGMERKAVKSSPCCGWGT